METLPNPNQQQLPADFAKRIAYRITSLLEREHDVDVFSGYLNRFFMGHLAIPGRERYFHEAMDFLLSDDGTQHYAALSYRALIINESKNQRQENFLDLILDGLIHSHMNLIMPSVTLEPSRKTFSGETRHIGDVLTVMININGEFYEAISNIYARIIRKEMLLDQQKDRKGNTLRLSMSERKKPKAAKKLFDEIVDYISAKGEFRSNSLNQQNPNEYMNLLADRLRGTRRYVIQDVFNKQALTKKKETEKELRARMAGAEDLVAGQEIFKRALHIFWMEKIYNFKYLSVEKIRVTLQVLSMVGGAVFFVLGYMGFYAMQWWEGVFVVGGMFVYTRLFFTAKAFKRYYPHDMSKELEVVLGMLTPVLRRMSKEQLIPFLAHQVRHPENNNLLALLTEFVRYVYAVMPDQKQAIINQDELYEILEQTERQITRHKQTHTD